MSFDPNAKASEESGIFGLTSTPEEARVVLVPVPFEATTSYGGGTAGGPAAILRASKQVDLWDLETGKPYEAGIAMLPEPSFPQPPQRTPETVDPISRKVDAWVRETCAHWLSRGGAIRPASPVRRAAADRTRGRCVGRADRRSARAVRCRRRLPD